MFFFRAVPTMILLQYGMVPIRNDHHHQHHHWHDYECNKQHYCMHQKGENWYCRLLVPQQYTQQQQQQQNRYAIMNQIFLYDYVDTSTNLCFKHSKFQTLKPKPTAPTTKMEILPIIISKSNKSFIFCSFDLRNTDFGKSSIMIVVVVVALLLLL